MAPQQKELVPNERLNKYIEVVDGIYDLSSCGMMVMQHVVSKQSVGYELSKWDRDALTTRNSNYIAQPYVQAWLKPGNSFFSSYGGPDSFSPLAASHAALILKMNEDYNALNWMWTREAFAGEAIGLMVSDPKKPISREELKLYFTEGLRRKTIDGIDEQLARRDPQIADVLNNADSLAGLLLIAERIEIPDDSNSFLNKILKVGVDVSGAFFEDYDRISVNDFHRSGLTVAALHKLGSMLALTEQALYDAHASGSPIKGSFKPENDKLEESCQKLFGTPTPILREAIQQAQQTFLELSDSDDPISGYIHDSSFDPVQYLA